eukprot:TRINITY_DN2110_c0_g1_i1.p1 TRINITY_DN2110_c0_g1~~TRINITY_DN2110_c0_g1_i1.p1  ORF type:complete len:396 (+),score=47.76 TRINITY_DN2110_c0_g1_i1:111-1298(+)
MRAAIILCFLSASTAVAETIIPYALQSENAIAPMFVPPGSGRYEYSPNIIPVEGKDVMFFAANINDQEIRDHILYRVKDPVMNTWGEPRVALAPAEKKIIKSIYWDSVHVCDPRVVKGDFHTDKGRFEYAMFYTGTNCYAANMPWKNCIGSSHNQVGVVYSKNSHTLMRGDWERVNNRPVIRSYWKYNVWGVGQPSARTLKKNIVELFYTVSYPVNRIVRSVVNLSTNKILQEHNVTANGLQDIGVYSDDIIYNNARFALVEGVEGFNEGMYVMIREQHPYPSDFISSHLQIAIINATNIGSTNPNVSWSQVAVLSPALTGHDRNHNPGFATHPSGIFRQSQNGQLFPLLFSSAQANASFNSELWTYRIHTINLKFSVDHSPHGPSEDYTGPRRG